MRIRLPFLRPNPPKLSKLVAGLEAIEASGIFTNYGPTNEAFERRMTEEMFASTGGCLTVCNATIGLMLAIRHAMGRRPSGHRRYALMPSFTFAATADAAQWAGLTPLLCDMDPDTWLPSPQAEDELLDRYGDEIAVIVPYATFGNDLDLDRYSRLARDRSIGIVVDAAASLGSLDAAGRGFGTGFEHAVVFSMHATKTFATAEAGVIYSADQELIRTLRLMGNYGFGQPRTSTMPGLNSKLSEVGALLALAKLDEFKDVVAHRSALADAYRTAMPGWTFQKIVGQRAAYQFMPALLPEGHGARRPEIVKALADRGIGVANYFSPHLAEHPWFRETCVTGSLPVTDELAARALSLPLSDDMSVDDVRMVANALGDVMSAIGG